MAGRGASPQGRALIAADGRRALPKLDETAGTQAVLAERAGLDGEVSDGREALLEGGEHAFEGTKGCGRSPPELQDVVQARPSPQRASGQRMLRMSDAPLGPR